MFFAYLFVYLLYAYLAAGLAFALWFVFRGDADMAEASWKLRLLLIPGTMALWPVLLRKYLKT
ncbi:MAG: hypothetical protein EAZ89_16765 [Bacteroidetes bacterium]|nr:MAG: hypothetical protein EAZ89_16765 [Bacteroidota bacterium]